ncbi:MAG: Stp1/IreP family PP2C-type Ser/Thr phosphatase [Candidatus Avilachnospira sp.]|jgi:serine/threonine protein phosphatase PrpC
MQAYALTDIGKKRKVNQDYIYETTENIGVFPNLFILADGMGGHKAGDYASKYLVDSMVDHIRKSDNGEIVKTLNNAISLSNTMIYRKSQEIPELSGMGSTLVAAVISSGVLYVANVGDSRLYIVRDGITQVTRDHSYVEEMVKKGQMTRDSEDYIMHKNIITRAVGISQKVEPDFFEVELEDNDYILLCSDGLTNMVDDDTILTVILGNGSLGYKSNTLIRTANENGGNDNIAVVLIKYQKEGMEHA